MVGFELVGTFEPEPLPESARKPLLSDLQTNEHGPKNADLLVALCWIDPNFAPYFNGFTRGSLEGILRESRL